MNQQDPQPIDPQQPTRPARFWEIDALRGVAVIWMIAFHLTYDLVLYRLVRINMSRGPWPWFSRIIATMFLTLAGTSLVISDSRQKSTRRFRRILLRGLKIFGFGLVISAVTYIGALLFVVFNLVTDICYSLVDPRVALD